MVRQGAQDARRRGRAKASAGAAAMLVCLLAAAPAPGATRGAIFALRPVAGQTARGGYFVLSARETLCRGR